MSNLNVTARLATVLICTCALASVARADDWPHYRGPNLDGLSTEKNWSDQWPAEGPKQLWKKNVGIGAASVAVWGDRLYVTGNDGAKGTDAKDTVWCLNAGTGDVVWRYEFACPLDLRQFDGGTAATPTIDVGSEQSGWLLYNLSHDGRLTCLDAKTGEKRWETNLKDHGGGPPYWAYSGSPLIEGDLLIVDAGVPGKGGPPQEGVKIGAGGASTIAFDKKTGAVKWKSGDDGASYASPVAAKIDGRETIVVMKAKAFLGLDAADGHELWRQAWVTDYDLNAASPIVKGDEIFVTAHYDHGGALFTVKDGKLTQRWANKEFGAQLATPSLDDGYLYGFAGNTGMGGALLCVDWKSGETKWTALPLKSYTGTLTIAGGRLIALTNKGELITAPATPEGFKPTNRVQVLGGNCWVTPVLANGRLYCKNNTGDLVAFDVRK